MLWMTEEDEKPPSTQGAIKNSVFTKYICLAHSYFLTDMYNRCLLLHVKKLLIEHNMQILVLARVQFKVTKECIFQKEIVTSGTLRHLYFMLLDRYFLP